MIAKLEPHGDKVALVLDDELLRQINASRTTEFSLTIEGKRLFLEPCGKLQPDKALEEAVADICDRYGDVLKKLAE